MQSVSNQQHTDSPGFTFGSDVSSDGNSPARPNYGRYRQYPSPQNVTPEENAIGKDGVKCPALSNELLMAHRLYSTPDSPSTPTQPMEYNSSLLSSGVHSGTKYEYTKCGNCYRVLCFSSFGIKVSILINLLMILANTFLIVYELYLIYEHKSFYETKLPFWYILSDLIVTSILLVEIIFNIGAAYNCHCVNYCCSRWDNMMDIIVFLLSAAGCGLYVFDWKQESLDNADNLLILALRVKLLFRFLSCSVFDFFFVFFFFFFIHAKLK